LLADCTAGSPVAEPSCGEPETRLVCLSAAVEAPVAVWGVAEVEVVVVGAAVVEGAEGEGVGEVGASACAPGVGVVDLGPGEGSLAAGDGAGVVGQGEGLALGLGVEAGFAAEV
jgi:hypothetical protein